MLAAGCGSGNKLITNRAGDVEVAKLEPDSIPEAPPPGEYVVGYGDVLDIIFLYNTQYSRQSIKVRPDGRISYPYIGEINAAGKTISQLDSLITNKFSEFIKDPDVTVIVREFQPQQVYVFGEVVNPGAFAYSRGLSLMNVLAMSNGITDHAKRNGVVVVRRIDYNHIVGIEVDIEQIIDEHRYDMDVSLMPFDIVLVPKSRIATLEDFTASMYNILVKPADIYLRGWQVANVKTVYDFYKRTGVAR